MENNYADIRIFSTHELSLEDQLKMEMFYRALDGTDTESLRAIARNLFGDLLGMANDCNEAYDSIEKLEADKEFLAVVIEEELGADFMVNLAKDFPNLDFEFEPES